MFEWKRILVYYLRITSDTYRFAKGRHTLYFESFPLIALLLKQRFLRMHFLSNSCRKDEILFFKSMIIIYSYTIPVNIYIVYMCKSLNITNFFQLEYVKNINGKPKKTYWIFNRVRLLR